MSMRFSFYWYFQNWLLLPISPGGSVGRVLGTNLLLMGAWVRVPLMQIFFSIGKIRGCGTLKFLVWLTSESRFSNLKKKLVIKRVWNNWFLQWNKKFIQSQNCYASWKFALFLLFLVQKCTKKGSNPNFLELWDLVLMSLMILEKIKKISPKMWPKTWFFHFGGSDPYLAPLGAPRGPEVTFFHWRHLFSILQVWFQEKNGGWKFYRTKSLSGSDIVC